uniref:Uncharacterized protein n=1 Tax=Arundo donax TaxID=35708 RepID=A0A0A9GN63_ARUDO
METNKVPELMVHHKIFENLGMFRLELLPQY